jgi:hypothetical protein
LSGGLAFIFNLNKKADVYENLLFPPGYEFMDRRGTQKTISSELGSLSGMNVGLYLGAGANCSVGYGFLLFTEVNYYLFPFSVLSDADLFFNKLNIRFGVRYQL